MEFYLHPFIKTIADIKAWTISDNEKIPIHMGILKNEARRAGANFYDNNSFMTLYELYNFYLTTMNSYPPNHAFYLDSIIHGFCVLDIEPDCPDDMKSELLKLPYLYGELSMSGKGYHLVFPLPKDILDQYPIVYQKVCLKEEHKYYEILLNHFCTFTGNQIKEADNQANPNGFHDLFLKLASEQKEINKAEVDISQIDSVDTKMADSILMLLNTATKQYTKTLVDYYNDESKYEFAFISFLYFKLKMILKVQAIKDEKHEYTDAEKAWFLWQTAKNYLKPRAKHKEFRNDLPWLLYLSFQVISITNANPTDN